VSSQSKKISVSEDAEKCSGAGKEAVVVSRVTFLGVATSLIQEAATLRSLASLGQPALPSAMPLAIVSHREMDIRASWPLFAVTSVGRSDAAIEHTRGCT